MQASGYERLNQADMLTRAVENVFRKLIRFLVGRMSLVKLQEMIRHIYVDEAERQLKKDVGERSNSNGAGRQAPDFAHPPPTHESIQKRTPDEDILNALGRHTPQDKAYTRPQQKPGDTVCVETNGRMTLEPTRDRKQQGR